MNEYLDETGPRGSLIVQSILSDCQIELSINPDTVYRKLNFVKFIINKLDGNLDMRINAEKLQEEFHANYITIN